MFLFRFSDSKNKKQPEAQGIADPLNALQNLAGQGSRPMPPQMMGMNNVMGGNAPNPNANVLQNLIHVRHSNQFIRRSLIYFVYYLCASSAATESTANARNAKHGRHSSNESASDAWKYAKCWNESKCNDTGKRY